MFMCGRFGVQSQQGEENTDKPTFEILVNGNIIQWISKWSTFVNSSFQTK